MNLVLVTAPTTLAVPPEAAMRHVRSTDQSEAPDVEELSKAAQRLIETRMDRALTEHTYRLSLDAFPTFIQLPRSPLIAIVDITYVDVDGVTQTMGVDEYHVDADAEPAVIEPAYGEEWPETRAIAGAVKVRYRCGHTDTRPAPPQGAQAIKLVVGHWYENREAVVTGTISTEVDMAVDALIGSCRIVAEYDQ